MNAARTAGSAGIGLQLNVLMSIIAFGLTPFFKKLAIDDGVSPWMVALVTSAVAAGTSLVVTLVRRPQALPGIYARRHLVSLSLIGFVATGLVTLLVVQALSSTTATNRSLFQAAYPAATLLFAHLLIGERLRLGQYGMIVLLMAGLLLMNGSGGEIRFGPGFWLLLATLPLIGVSDAYSKRLTAELSPLLLAAGRNFYGAVFLLVITPFLGLGALPDLCNGVWLLAAGFLQGVGVWTLYRAFELSKASLVTAMVAVAPLVTLAVESFFIGLRLDVLQWAGLIVVMATAALLAQSGAESAAKSRDRSSAQDG